MLVIDIETAPHPDAPQPSESYLNRGMGNRVNEEAIQSKRNENAKRWFDHAALDWRLNLVSAIGVGFTGPVEQVADRVHLGIYVPGGEKAIEAYDLRAELVGSSELERLPASVFAFPSEAHLLNWFWGWVRFPLVGFGLRHFDVPCLLGRSTMEDVVVRGPPVDLNRYTSHDVIDLMDLLSFQGEFDLDGWTLGTYAQRFKLWPGPDEMEGMDVVKAWLKGEYGKVLAHLYRDVLTTMALARRSTGLIDAVRRR